MTPVIESVGQQLKSARQQKGWTLEFAARQTRIRRDQIEWLEEDDFGRFPSLSYAKGFVRIYSRALGLNDRRLLSVINSTLEEEPTGTVLAPAVEYMPEGIHSIPRISSNALGAVLFGGLILGVVAVLLYAGLSWMSGFFGAPHEPAHRAVATELRPVRLKPPVAVAAKTDSGEANIPVARAVPANSSDDNIPVARAVPADATPDVPVARAVPVAPAPSSGTDNIPVARAVPVNGSGGGPVVAKALPVENTIILTGLQNSQVKILQVDGNEATELFNDTLNAGQSKTFTGSRFRLQLENASAVKITYNGADAGTYSPEAIRAEFDIPGTP
jgi:cytoskeletal protein RodZ